MIKKPVFSFFTTKEIKPAGWLRRQLEIQAEGLSGNLDRIWPDIRDSSWVGGDRDGWERVPYWLDGFIPLAYLLEDKDKITRAKRYMDAIFAAQSPDGWICPCTPEQRSSYDLWAVLLMAKVLTVYADCSGDDRAEKALSACLRHLNGFLNGCTLHNWGAARWFEGVIPALWLYDRTGEEWLLDLCEKLEVQGIHWKDVVHSHIWARNTEGWDLLTHVVNVAMMLKSDALMCRLHGGDANAFARESVNRLLREHGMAVPHFTGDENLAGTSPIHGSELCGVVEAMYSYENLLSLTGDPAWADILEKVAFNALPAACSPDMWSHQYDQLSNQVECTRIPDGKAPFRSNGGDAHCFGLEPNFGCCTANFNQGWPKFALSAFMKDEEGIVSCLLIPTILSTHISQTAVKCELRTEYPFRDTLSYRISSERAVRFSLKIRIPSFALSAAVDGVEVKPGEMVVLHRLWEGESEIAVTLRFENKFESHPDCLLSLWRGPLLYALPIAEKWEKREYEAGGVPRKFPYCDYDVTPTGAWNYGFDGEAAAYIPRFCEYEVPFTPTRPPVILEGPMAKISWKKAEGCCARLPESDVSAEPTEICRLIPYGCTNLRISETWRVKRQAPQKKEPTE